MMIFMILGVLCLTYYFIIITHGGFHIAFANFWLVAALGCFAIIFFFKLAIKHDIISKIPIAARYVAGTVIAIGVIIFAILFISVASKMNEKPAEDAECLVVLGAKVEGNKITKSLRRRLEAAKEYLVSHEDAIVVVSGGQGRYEDISEAEAMYDYLVKEGIDSTRIYKEDKSTTTKENLEFSREIAKEVCGEDVKIAIVTNNFHLYRAELLAKNMGIQNVSGIPADSDPILFINYMFRECAALVKEKMLGNI